MEFVVTGLEQLPQQIDCNFEELKNSLNESLEKYSNIVVTPDSISAAKKTRSDLNKLRAAIDERRKEIKREWNKPYDEFEGKVKSLLALVDKPISAIDTQIKVYDEQRIEEKRTELLACYTASIGDLADILSFDRFLDPKWKNVTADLDKLKEDMQKKIGKCKSDMKVIATTCKQYIAACQQKYIDTLDISDAFAEFKRLEELDRRREIAEAEEKKAKEKEIVIDVQPDPVPQEAPAPITTAPPVSDPVPEIPKTIDVRFFDTSAAFRADMKALCIKHGIQYGNVPKGV